MTKNKIDDVFEIGKQYTVFDIDSMMAMTHKREIEITEFDTDGNPIFKMKGKRKRFIFRLRSRLYQSSPLIENKSAIFEGWEQPIKCDTENRGTMRGNACYNFVASPEDIRAWIDAGQLNPNFERDHVLSVPASGDGTKGEIVVYPELNKGGHAVIDRLMPA